MTMRTKLTVGHLVLWVGVAAMACGALFAAHSDWIWALFAAYPLWLFTPWGRPTARWCPVVFALAVVALAAGGRAGSPGRASTESWGSLSFRLPGDLALTAPGRRGAREADGTPIDRLCSSRVACLLTMFSVVATEWPLHLTFLASRSEFDAFATRLEAGYRMTEPERVGRFLILKAEMREGRPCLWLDIDPAGYDGFVRNPRRGPDGKLLGPSNTQFDHWSARPSCWTTIGPSSARIDQNPPGGHRPPSGFSPCPEPLARPVDRRWLPVDWTLRE